MNHASLSPLDLEVTEVERKSPAGCSGGGSSSTNPRCTCPVIFVGNAQ